MSYIKSLLIKLQARIIHTALFSILALLVLYLSCAKFRIFLEAQNIDPNFIIGFFTIVALLLSLIQSSKDKRYSYNLKLIDSIEDKGLMIIGKLLGIRSKSLVVLSSAKHCVKAKRQGKVFKDLNNSLSKEDVESEMELVAAYIDSYFPEQKVAWNDLINKLTDISNITNNILINYQDNLELIMVNSFFKNSALDNADDDLKTAEDIDREIDEIAFSIRNGIVGKINESKSLLKNTFDFKL